MTRRRALLVSLLALAIPTIAAAQEGNDGWGGARTYVTFGVGVQTQSPKFGYDFATTLFDETAKAALDTPGKRAATFDIAGGVRVVQNLGVGLTYSRYSTERTATLSTTIPSPLFFGESSTIERQIPLQRGEDAVHVQAIYRIPIAAKLNVGVFGGPTFFRCRDDVVTQFSLLANVSPTLDWSVAFKDVTMGIDRDKTWGYNSGADVTYMLTRYLGIGTMVRYSRASHNTVNHFAATGDLFENGVWGAADSNGTVEMKHGGFHWNGGVTFRF